MGTKFIVRPKKQVISKLIENKRRILGEYVDAHGEKHGEKTIKRYQDYLDTLDSNKKLQKELATEIICMLLNLNV